MEPKAGDLVEVLDTERENVSKTKKFS